MLIVTLECHSWILNCVDSVISLEILMLECNLRSKEQVGTCVSDTIYTVLISLG
jgi:hypothetical protein